MDIQKVIDGLDLLFANKQSDRVEDYLLYNLEQALNEKDAGSAITIMNELIGFYRDSSQYDKAQVYCEKLPPFMEKVGLKDTIHYGTSCLNIANAYRAAGRLEDSLEYYMKVFAIYEKTLSPKDFRYASLYNNLSLLYQEMNEFDKASEELLQALSIIREYPEAVVEQAVTYTNLAVSCLRAGRKEKAKEAIQEGISIFENGLQEDYHYSAALSVMGDIAYEEKQYQQAVSCYEKAMISLKSHVGLTHAYFRIITNLQTCYDAMKQPDKLKGINLAKDYYEQHGREVFEVLEEELCDSSKQGQNLPLFAYGKVGEGSECFGFDDILSMDHDFGPGFCIFVTREQYKQYGERLEDAYQTLPISFRGFERVQTGNGVSRNGIIVIEDFFGRILSLSEKEVEFLMRFYNLPEEVWLRLEDWQLCTVTNGCIFEGEDTVFGKIYHTLSRGYPESVRRRKIAQKLGEICQEGQYNYKRLMMRGDSYGACFMKHSFEGHVVELLYLINCVYAPHDKWMWKMAERLPKGAYILDEVGELLTLSIDDRVYNSREMVDWIGITNYEDKVLTKIEEIAGKIAELLFEEGLTEVHASYLEDHIAYLLGDV